MKIAEWDKTFENAESRRLKTLTWIAFPVGFHSSGYHALLDEFGEDAAGVYGAWCALCSLAGTCPVRGQLASSSGVAYTIRRIARETHLSEHWLNKLIPWAIKQGWLIEDDPESPSVNSTTPTPCDDTQQSPSERPADAQQPVGEDWGNVGLQDRTGPNRTGQEKGREEGSGEPVPAVAGTPPCPADEVVESFNRTFGTKARLTAKRRKQLTARWRDPHWREHWRQALERAGPSDFLSGQNNRNWRIDLEFFLRPDTVTKILEGKYDNRDGSQPASKAAEREQSNADSFSLVFGQSDSACPDAIV